MEQGEKMYKRAQSCWERARTVWKIRKAFVPKMVFELCLRAVQEPEEWRLESKGSGQATVAPRAFLPELAAFVVHPQQTFPLPGSSFSRVLDVSPPQFDMCVVSSGCGPPPRLSWVHSTVSLAPIHTTRAVPHPP